MDRRYSPASFALTVRASQGMTLYWRRKRGVGRSVLFVALDDVQAVRRNGRAILEPSLSVRHFGWDCLL